MSEDREQQIRARLTAATEGPWSMHHRCIWGREGDDERCGSGWDWGDKNGGGNAPPEPLLLGAFARWGDADFVMHVHEDLAWLLDRLAEARAALAEKDAEIQRLRELKETWRNDANLAEARVKELEAEGETERMRLAGCLTAAEGYWEEGDSIHPDYYCEAIRVVAALYAKQREAESSLAALRAENKRVRALILYWRGQKAQEMKIGHVDIAATFDVCADELDAALQPERTTP